MREILFRAKRVDNSKWIEGYYVKYESHLNCDCYYGIVPTDAGGLYAVRINPETLCRYIGKSDEDGKKIFEGDIVGFIDLYSTESGYSEHSCVGEVVWGKEECCFHVTNRLSAESWEVLDECKVVGNVFDDKELLEEF